MTTNLQTRIAAIKAECEEILRLDKTATPRGWICGCLANDDHPCNCTYILAEPYCGSIAEITVGNGKPISDGGNDAPPVEEAKSNLRLLVKARNVSPAMARVVIVTIRNIEYAMQIDKLRERATEAAEELVKQWEDK